eukprot:TRINITY_DN539_c0_g1_i1.p1 TRINITY_DN539_c0_g1~~TRINITY_DN539_c0_g1_i1.p1  ORF type:complete len:807 (+),score=265.40 TRINITY_DN539_c0_g1_i1:43-2463(+)
MKTLAMAMLLLGAAQTSTAVWSNGPESFNCKMRKLAWEYGQKTVPRLGKFENLYYALGLNKDCQNYTGGIPSFTPADQEAKRGPFPTSRPGDAAVLFVDCATGSDGNSGSITAPLKTIQAAVTKGKGQQTTVNLRAGTCYLTEAVQVTAENKDLTIQNYNGEAVTVSGGKKVGLDWQPYNVANGNNMYTADMSQAGIDYAWGFQMNGVRATRARYPNGNVELPERQEEAGNPQGVQMIPSSAATWTPPDLSEQGKQKYVTNTNPSQMRNFTTYGFQEYMVGIGGPCDIYDPPVAYWCSQDPSGGGAFAFRVPQGVTPSKSVIAPPNGGPDSGLHMPYKNIEGAILNVWRPARWANWMFEAGPYDTTTNNITFGLGGFQGSRGSNVGGDWFIENVFEEFDYPNEFFYDRAAKKMYFYHNATGAPPADGEYVIPQIKTLFNLTAETRWNPIVGVTIRGLKMTATRYTYMEAHGVPSGGDWALDRMGAVFLEGTEQCTVDSNFITRIDGNGVFVSGYNRNATVSRNEFAWIGGNSLAAWGYTNETAANPLEGFDGTDGNHPRYTNIINNVAREIGHYEKQSAFYFQGKVAESNLQYNVFFNGPRAGINFNDGFGGADTLHGNLVFSALRETQDHGPFNSWDRQPFLTTVRTGEPSVQMAWRTISNNFFINNYNQQEDIDNDDGSGFFHTHDNFFVSGNVGMKNDFGGHDNWHFDNIYGYVKQGFGICSQIAGHVDAFFNNTLVMTSENVGSGEGCSGPGATIVKNLNIFTPSGKATECGHSPPQSPGTTVNKLPTDEYIINLAKTKLGM